MTIEQKNIEKQFNALLMDLDLTDEQAENIMYLKRYVLEALRIHDVVWRSEQLKAYAEYLQTRPDFQERSNKDLAIDYCDSL